MRLLTLLALALPLGCGLAGRRQPVHQITVVPMVGIPKRDAFSSRLVSMSGATSDSEGGVRASGNIRLTVQGDTALEYHLTVDNPHGALFTRGQLHRRQGNEVGQVVATFFSDADLRDLYIQVRGTVSVSRGVEVEELITELRRKPDAFYVNVSTASRPDGALRGRLE
jgi:hypothetical protein